MRHIIYMLCLALASTFCGHAVAQRVYTLEQILDSAQSNNISIRQSRLNIEQAREQKKETFTKYFPTVSGTGLWFNANKGMAQMDIDLSKNISPELQMALAQSLPIEALAALANPTSISMMKNGTIASITAVQPVFAGGQIINGNKLAAIGEEASSLQLDMAKNEVIKTAEQYFWQIVTLQEKMKTINRVDSLLASIHRDVDIAVKAGVALRNDLLQVQLRQNEVESQKLKLNNGITLVKMLLAQYCGIRDTAFSLAYNTDIPSPIALKQDHQQALPHTTEYQLLTKQVEVAQLQHKMEIGKNLPTVGIGLGYNYHTLMDKDHNFGMVFATVNVPISDWWGGSHAIKRKKIEQQKAIEQLNDNAELLTIRMQMAWNDVEEAYQQLGITQRSIEQAEENLRINRNTYQAGTSTMSNLLEAQLLFQQALDGRTEQFADYQNKLLEYKQAIGQ